MTLANGTKLGPYEIKSLIGEGGMGVVYRARDTRLQRDVAIKVLPVSFARDEERLRRFEQEARAVAALNDPHLLIVFDVGTMPLSQDSAAETAPYLVSELLEGQTLRERLRSGPLSERKALDYAVQIARGLAAAQARGIVHRDVKPENIFLTNEGRVKILDFGLAKLTGQDNSSDETALETQAVHTRIDVVMGTAGYMSPEQLRGKPVDARSDIFAFGAVLYEMLSGKRAFTGDSSADVMSAILNQDPPELTSETLPVSPGLDHIVRRCLEKNPQQRFQSAGDLAFALQELSSLRSGSGSGMLAKAAPEAGGAGVLRWLGSLPGAATLAVIALLVGAVGAWLLTRGHGHYNPPQYKQITYQQGLVRSARILHDGQTILSASQWGDERKMGLHVGTLETVGVRSLDTPADSLAAVSVNDDILLVRDMKSVGPGYVVVGTLAEMHYGGGAPRALLDNVQYADWDPEGKKFAVVRFIPESHHYRLEYPVGTVLYQTEGWISNPRFSRDGKSIAFLDHPIFGDDQGSAALVDLKGKVRKWKRVYGSTQCLAWSPDGKEIWFSAADAGLARQLWAASLDGSERSLLSGPATMDIQDVLPTGRTLVTNLEERRVQMVVTPEFPQPRDFTWMDWAYSQRFSADGKQLVFGDQHSGELYGTFLRNLDGTPAVRLGDGDPLDISPDGKYVASRLPLDPAQIELLPTGTGEQRQMTHEKFGFQSARWLDNQRLIAAANQPGHPIRSYVVDMEGRVTPLTPEGVQVRAITGDGKHVMLSQIQVVDGTAKNIYTMAPVVIGSNGEVQLGPAVPTRDLAKNEFGIDFNVDGSAIYIGAQVNHDAVEIWQVDLATGNRTLLKTVDPPGISSVNTGVLVTVSRDGKSYAYQYHPALSTLYLIDGLRSQ